MQSSLSSPTISRVDSFQSSPNLSVECSLHVGHIQVQVVDVSILAQPLGRCFNPHLTSRLGAGGGYHTPNVFQSSPNLLAGCSGGSGIVVSILAQPLGWVQRYTGGRIAGAPAPVSILTQPFGWAQPVVTWFLVPPKFQSSSNLWVGCRAISLISFNPQPNLSAGCIATPVAESLGCHLLFSILTQPLGWVHLVGQPAFAGFASVSILTELIGWAQ